MKFPTPNYVLAFKQTELSTILMFWCSSSILAMFDPANDIIPLEKLGTKSLDNPVNTFCFIWMILPRTSSPKLCWILTLLLLKIIFKRLYTTAYKGSIPVGWFLIILSPSYTFPLLSGVHALQKTELQQFKCLDVLPRSSENWWLWLHPIWRVGSQPRWFNSNSFIEQAFLLAT